MKKRNVVFLVVTFLCVEGLFSGIPCAADQYETSGINANVIYLTPGHTQTITFPLDGAVTGNLNAFHTTFFLLLGSGTITVRVGTASAVGDFSNVTYSVVGFISTSLIAAYGNDAEVITLNAEANGFAVGVLFTGITIGLGNPNYPIIMSMVASLLE